MGQNPELVLRERAIVKLMNSYGYNHSQASKLYEIIQVRQFEFLFGTAVGGFLTYKMLPLQRELSASNALFRKTWMKYPLLAGTFAFGYHCASMLPVKLFNKFSKNYNGIDHDNYRKEADLVGRFRLFDKVAEAEGKQAPSSTEDEILDYLSIHSKDPMSKKELVEHMMSKISQKVDLGEKFRIKRMGKDLNDTYYSFGKVHGLENIAFVDEEKLKAAKGNPVAIQELVNEVVPENIKGYASSEELISQRTKNLENYKELINGMSLQPSDRKKLLALPFALSKRAQKPEPKTGTAEIKIYEEMTGRPWNYRKSDIVDEETKITEFDYENHLDPQILAKYDSDTDDFKQTIRALNFMTKTQHE